MDKKDIYKDISLRTGGDIYLGVVGPVRTGKSTFIKNFMEMFVIPNIENEFKQDRAKDELPQSAAGKTIMTTEPKFVPNESVEIKLDNNVKFKTRLVDCVGYLVEDSLGYLEDDMPRKVKTPWSDEDLEFSVAAEMGTKKVITDHSTIGLVVTTDGSITDIDRDSYVEAEERVVNELKEINKPFVVILNSIEPQSDETMLLRSQLEAKYNAPVMATNILELDENDVREVFERVLGEFPVTEIGFILPNWFSILDFNHWFKQDIVSVIKNTFSREYSLREVTNIVDDIKNQSEMIKDIMVDDAQMSSGVIKIKIDVKDEIFYKILTEISGSDIKTDGDIFKIMKEFNEAKNEYDKIKMALEEVRIKGYGIVTPQMDELSLEEPEIVKQGTKFGVKLKASAPSIHIEGYKQKCNGYKKRKKYNLYKDLQHRTIHINIKNRVHNKIRNDFYYVCFLLYKKKGES